MQVVVLIEHYLSYDPMVHDLTHLHRAPQHWGHLLFYPFVNSTDDLHFKHFLYSECFLCFMWTNFCRLLFLGTLVWPHAGPALSRKLTRGLLTDLQTQLTCDPKIVSTHLFFFFFLLTILFSEWLQVEILNLFIQISQRDNYIRFFL